jgi:hypothetical protein
MRRLRKLLRAPFGFKMLLAEAFLRLLAVSVLLRATPRTRFNPNRRDDARVSPTVPDSPSIEVVCKAVVIAADYVPGATCLVRCIAARAMLARYGFVARIRIGVLRDSSHFPAHAWLEKEGSVLLGGDITQYVQLGNTLDQ